MSAQEPRQALRADAEVARPLPPAGRYEGTNAEALIELRVDGAETGLVSADLYRLGAGDRRDWVASLRSVPSDVVGPATVIAEDDLGGATTGVLSIGSENGAGGELTATLILNGPLNGLPGRSQMSFAVDRASDALRSLGIEIEAEDGVEAAAGVEFEGRRVTLQSCLEDAGFAIEASGESSKIPSTQTGWAISELHTLMADFAAASLSERAWNLQLLLLSRSDQQGLLGVMFDDTELLPRQGLAVFADEIRSIPGIEHERKLIQTTVHEVGHALNLAHRFERVVGRADSLSFMNYDWRYKGGDKEDEFWADFSFTFDPDELAFLRHGPRTAVIPGGAPFHSVRYWNEGSGGYSPYVPEAPLEGFKLELRPPVGGRLFAFAQPVFLEVELTNQTDQPIDLPPVLLDPKGGFLELLVRNTHGTSTRSLADAEPFVPILQRCFDIDPSSFETVAPGNSIRDNVNLTYGSSGFAFAEPGAYEITALLAISDNENERDLIVRSEPLPIRVASPASIEEERDAMDLFRDDVGVFLALGGNRTLTGAREALQGILERREGDDASEIHDPVVAAIVRAAALDASRSYVRYEDGDFREIAAEPERAARLLARLQEPALRAFDPETARGTRELAERSRDRAG